jgi:EAL domain-containing protein (putative c-di-GMP-specific phosphodiesterase class I)
VPERTEGLLTDIGVQGENIEFEITESILVENCGQSQSILASLNKLGIRVAIDDFGTGYSSMAYLKDFAIQTLKIDRSFVSDYDKNRVSAVILKNMITLGNDLGMSIIAEGIETKEQEDHLKKIGCDIGQGYYLTRPIPAPELEEFLIAKDSDNILLLNPSKNYSSS